MLNSCFSNLIFIYLSARFFNHFFFRFNKDFIVNSRTIMCFFVLLFISIFTRTKTVFAQKTFRQNIYCQSCFLSMTYLTSDRLPKPAELSSQGPRMCVASSTKRDFSQNVVVGGGDKGAVPNVQTGWRTVIRDPQCRIHGKNKNDRFNVERCHIIVTRFKAESRRDRKKFPTGDSKPVTRFRTNKTACGAFLWVDYRSRETEPRTKNTFESYFYDSYIYDLRLNTFT